MKYEYLAGTFRANELNKFAEAGWKINDCSKNKFTFEMQPQWDIVWEREVKEDSQ